MTTRIQRRIYEFIKTYINEYYYAPSLLEIAQGTGIKTTSKSLIHRYVHALVKQGLLEFTGVSGEARRLRLPAASRGIPFMGKIAAGKPLEAVATPEFLALDQLWPGENRFALRVQGDSMIDEGIHDGDIVICEQRTHAIEGEIVVALIDRQEATLKKIHYTVEQQIALIPANLTLKTMIYAADRIEIQGIFIGLLRFPWRKH